MEYLPTKKSVNQHRDPQWHMDAKLGIFIHWGIFSVPAFAPIEYGDITEIIANHGPQFAMKNHPYAEWYLNSLRTGSKVYQDYHKNTYGEDFKYEQFAEIFKEESQNWNPKEWADLFKKAGAKYCVLTTKHCEGFLMWPSDTENPNHTDYYSKRDLVGELANAVRKVNIKFGVYYIGIWDWSFNTIPITDLTSYAANAITTQEFADYSATHFKELIDKYKPDVLYSDIGYPIKGNAYEIISYYLNKVPDGAVNNRWQKFPKWLKILPKTFLLKKIINWVGKRVVKKKKGLPLSKLKIGDYLTPEYTTTSNISDVKFEVTRGIGRSFGYNKMETEEHYLSEKELIWLFIDIVSKNGNLLLNIGPKADGSVPEIQKNRLLSLGKWIRRNEKGIYATIPWKRAEAIAKQISNNIIFKVRYTASKDGKNLFIFLSEIPDEGKVKIENLTLTIDSEVYIMDDNDKRILTWKKDGDDVVIDIPNIPKNWISLGIACNI